MSGWPNQHNLKKILKKKSFGNLKAQFPNLSALLAKTRYYVYICIQNVKDGIKIRECKAMMCRDTFCWGGAAFGQLTNYIYLKKVTENTVGNSLAAWLTFDELSCKFDTTRGRDFHFI